MHFDTTCGIPQMHAVLIYTTLRLRVNSVYLVITIAFNLSVSSS